MEMWSVILLRYKKPLEALSEDWIAKLIISVGIGLWALLQDMFATKVELVLLLLVAIVLDFFTGVASARRNKTIITSFGIRQTVVKAIEYTILLLISVGISNVFGDHIPFIENLSLYAFLFCILTEFKSIIENISEGDETRIREIYNKLIDLLKKKNVK